MEVCCGTYSYCRGQKGNQPANDLPALEALQRIAASPAHYNDVYLGGTEISQLIGAEFGSEEVELRRVQAARRRVEAMGLRVRATLIGSKVEPLGAALAQGRRRVEQAAALGLRIIIDFGPPGDGTEQEVLHKYIDYMKQLAPHAQSHGIGISMKPHGTLLTNAALIEVHKAVDHPGFGICMDPGNVLFYTKVRRSRAAQELDDLQLEAAELDDLQELAPRVTCVVMKDCALNPSSPQTQDYEVDAGEALPKVDVLVVPGTGVVRFEPLLAALAQVGYSGPLCIEKVPGRSLAAIDANFAKAKAFVEQVKRAAVSGVPSSGFNDSKL